MAWGCKSPTRVWVSVSTQNDSLPLPIQSDLVNKCDFETLKKMAFPDSQAAKTQTAQIQNQAAKEVLC